MISHLTLFCAQIDLAGNQLCGLNYKGHGTYTAEGIKAIASAISVSASLTAADLRYNCLDDVAEQGLRDVVKDLASFTLDLR